MAKRIFIILLFSFSYFGLNAQTPGKVEVIKDPKMDSLIKRRLELEGAANTAEGFRVQIYLGNDRQKAYDEQARFRKMYPGVRSYISYAQPNYKILAGDYKTRLEAEKLMNALKPYFSSLFIFPAKINLR